MTDARRLLQKLGVKPESCLWCVHPPTGFLASLPVLNNEDSGLNSTYVDVDPHTGLSAQIPILLSFTESKSDLMVVFKPLFLQMGPDSVWWFAWPKKASNLDSDLSFSEVQQVGLRHGLVDNKVCSIDETWSALRMTVRKENRIDWNPADYL